MAYTRQYTEDVGWQNTPSVATPINATNLNKMDDAIGNIDAAVYSEFIEAERIATSSNVGRVKPDNTTISVDGNGVISVVDGLPEIPLSIAHGGTGNSAGYIRTGNAAGVTGNKATIEGHYNAGLGAYCHVEGSYNEASASANNSHVGGTHNSSQYDNQTVIGTYNANSSDDLFEIGNGVSGNRSNAFAVKTNGDASVGRNMTVAGDLTVLGDIIGGTDDIYVKSTNSSGTVSALNIGSFTPVNESILIIHVLNNVATSETTWIVQMGMVSYGILKQDGSYYTDNLTAGQYLMLITDTSNSRFILLSSGSGADVPIATTSVAGKVKPDGSSIVVDVNGTITALGGGDVPIATTQVAGKVKPDGTTITITQDGTISAVGGGGDDGEMYTGTLLAASWSNKSQTVSVSGLKSSDIGAVGVLNTATAAQYNAAKAAVIKPTTVSNGTITFTCENVPSVDIPFGILVTGTSPEACIPDGGTTGQLLAKHSNTDLDVEWVDAPASIPNGGTTGQVLAKHSDTDRDVEWTNMPDTSKFYASDDTAFTDIVDADYVPIYDSSASTKKKSLWSNIKSLLKTYFDTLYASKLAFSTSEQEIGTWINGDKVYQKTLSVTIPTTNTDGTGVLAYTSIGASVKKVISISGIFETSARNSLLIEHTMTPVSSTTIKQTLVGVVLNSSTSTDKNKIFIQNSTKAFNGCSGYVTIQYTKA